jgi:hypothetical protein
LSGEVEKELTGRETEATTGRIQVGEMLVHEGAEAYKQEGRAQGHAAPGRQAEGQGQTPMIWAG